VRIDVLALLALVYHKQEKELKALETLDTALALAEPGGWIRNFIDLGAPMRALLERLSQVDPSQEFVRKVLQAGQAGDAGGSPSGAKAGGRIRMSGQSSGPVLTQREIELLALLDEGLSNKEMAAKLYIATETVKTHLHNIYRKLDAGSRLGALKKARMLGLVRRD
jgi:LuxR family maltose regulon positive regulatory protein